MVRSEVKLRKNGQAVFMVIYLNSRVVLLGGKYSHGGNIREI